MLRTSGEETVEFAEDERDALGRIELFKASGFAAEFKKPFI